MKQLWTSLINRLSPGQATFILILTAVCFGTVPWFAGELLQQGIASPAIAFYRYIFTTVLFFSILKFSREKRKETFWALFSGACVGMGWVSYVEALKVVPVSSVSVIYMTYPLFTLLASWLLIGNKPGARSVAAGALVLIAAVLAFTPGNLSNDATQAMLVAFIAPLTFGLSISILTDKLQILSPLERLTGFSTGAALGLLPLLFNYEFDQVIPSQPQQWMYIGALALFTALIPQYLYSTLAPIIGPAKSAMAGSVELPTMFIVGMLAFGESIGMLQIVAGVLVVSAVLITPAISSHRRVVQFETDADVSVISDNAYEDWVPQDDITIVSEDEPQTSIATAAIQES
ncbi:MAG: drug/metabolite transporter (DMT)-like permease [Gammaproteobacteria bacterium]|jgi:drug/metabolite transporter (DMT)-like permease